MSGDVVARARSAAEGLRAALARDVEFGESSSGRVAAADAVLGVMPELVAEVERLRAALGVSRARPVPEEGRVWRYRSPASDGAEVLVRFHRGRWEDADPEVPGRWYEASNELLSWPGVFTELESGLPR